MQIKAYKFNPSPPTNFKPQLADIIGPTFVPPYRFIFENQHFTEKEKQSIAEFKKFPFYDSLDHEYWTDAQLLRYIQGAWFNLSQAQKDIEAHDKWRAFYISDLDLKFQKSQHYLVD